MHARLSLRLLLPITMLGLLVSPTAEPQQRATNVTLPRPGFHHLHLNSTDPEQAIIFYTRQFPSVSRTTFAGLPAVQAGNVLLVFSKVATPAPNEPQSAFWHFGWHVVNSHLAYEKYRQVKDLRLLPLYRSDAGEIVWVNTDSWPGMLTRPQIAQARASGIKANPVGGWAYMRGPDGVTVEYHGDFPRERFNHVHMWQEQPFCAERWYQQHLMASESPSWPMRGGVPRPDATRPCEVPKGEPSWPSLERQGTIRVPPGGVSFDDVELNWYPNQSERRLTSSRGEAIDHVALVVTNLDAWFAALKTQGVTILREPHALGETRALQIEGPSREVIELVERTNSKSSPRMVVAGPQ